MNGPSSYFAESKPNLVILRKRVPGLSEPVLSRFVTQAGRVVHLQGAVNVLVTTSQELRALNRRFRKIDKTTDVLSFPPMFDEGFAGDIAVSADIAARNARQLRHAAADEVKILVLHGVLHLAGYDHEKDDGEMARLELRLRKKLALPSGLIERNGSSGTLKTGRGRKG